MSLKKTDLFATHLWEICVGLTKSLKILVGNKLKFHIDHYTAWNQNQFSLSKPNEKLKLLLV